MSPVRSVTYVSGRTFSDSMRNGPIPGHFSRLSRDETGTGAEQA